MTASKFAAYAPFVALISMPLALFIYVFAKGLFKYAAPVLLCIVPLAGVVLFSVGSSLSGAAPPLSLILTALFMQLFAFFFGTWPLLISLSIYLWGLLKRPEVAIDKTATWLAIIGNVINVGLLAFFAFA